MKSEGCSYGVQVLAAQWVHDAVMAYNTLVEHVSALPQQSVPPGVSCTTLYSIFTDFFIAGVCFPKIQAVSPARSVTKIPCAVPL